LFERFRRRFEEEEEIEGFKKQAGMNEGGA
jgi:hypothetical protein